MAKYNLIHLMNHSDLIVCNGYEIDNFWEDYHNTNKTRLMCGDDDIAFFPSDQEVEINEKLEVLPIEQDGELWFFEFKILTPLNPNCLPRSNTMTKPTPKRRVTPDHLPDTVYPFFWVQPIEASGGTIQVLDSWDDAFTYGLYRYNKPDETGVSLPDWVSDFEDVETADAIAASLNLIRDLHQMSVSLPDLGDLHENLEIARTLLV